MTERWFDQFLGEPLGDATRAEVLEALRGHILAELVAEEENPDGSAASHVQGILVEASRDPGTREAAELFSVVTDAAANAWHKDGPRWEGLAAADGAPPYLRECLDAAKQRPLLSFGVPETGITQYPGAESGQAGYRFTREDGSTLAVILWHGVMHMTEDGDIAPGLGGFTVEVDGDGEASPAD